MFRRVRREIGTWLAVVALLCPMLLPLAVGGASPPSS
jgi:hypothetical protein